MPKSAHARFLYVNSLFAAADAFLPLTVAAHNYISLNCKIGIILQMYAHNMSDSGAPEITGPAAAAAAGVPVPDPPGVAWSEQEEYLLALWADRALCYKLMHERAQQIYKRHHMWFSIPVIILSTVTGTANVAIAAYVPAPYQGIAQLVIGIVNLIGGVLSTLQNYFRSAEKCESHRHASVSWGKLYRAIFVELSVARAKRRPVVDFMRVCRTDYDRLTEGSPPLRSDVRAAFAAEAAANAAGAASRGAHHSLILPEECGTLLHTSSWEHAGGDRTRALAARGAADFLEDGAARPPVDAANALFANKASALSTSVVGALAASTLVGSTPHSDDFTLALSKSSSALAYADNYFPKKIQVEAYSPAAPMSVPAVSVSALSVSVLDVEPIAPAPAVVLSAPAVSVPAVSALSVPTMSVLDVPDVEPIAPAPAVVLSAPELVAPQPEYVDSLAAVIASPAVEANAIQNEF